MYRQGLRARDIAEATGFSLAKVKSAIQRHGAVRGGRLERKATSMRNEIDAMRAEGLSWAEVAKRIGEREPQLASACHRLGIGAQGPSALAKMRSRANAKYPLETYATAQAMWRRGLCDYHIAQRLGLPRTTVETWIQTQFAVLGRLA